MDSTKILPKPTQENDEEQKHLFILLGSLDSKQLTVSSMIDSLIKQEKHFGFVPSLDFSFIEALNEIFSNLSINTNLAIGQTTKELKQKLEEIENCSLI